MRLIDAFVLGGLAAILFSISPLLVILALLIFILK